MKKPHTQGQKRNKKNNTHGVNRNKDERRMYDGTIKNTKEKDLHD
jgi:hypothetical protein